MADDLRRNHRRKFGRICGGSEESSDATTRPRSARGSPGEHRQDRVMDLATENRWKRSRYLRRNGRRRHGSRRQSAWRERPHPWPRAWQAKPPFRVVAHATALLLATAPAVAPPGGRHRTPPEERRAATCTTIGSCPSGSPRASRVHRPGQILDAHESRGNTSRGGPVPPWCSPSRSSD
jgi:hypothetical protein